MVHGRLSCQPPASLPASLALLLLIMRQSTFFTVLSVLFLSVPVAPIAIGSYHAEVRRLLDSA